MNEFEPTPIRQHPKLKQFQAALHSLEWPKFVQQAAAHCKTQPGRERIERLIEPAHWALTLEIAKNDQQETLEILPLLDRESLWGPLDGLSSPLSALETLNRGAVLDAQNLGLIRNWLFAFDSWILVPRDEIKSEKFKKAIASLFDPQLPLRLIEKVITPDNEVSERASPKLSALNTEIKSLKRDISSTLDRLQKHYSQKGILQENFSDLRDGRYVLPVKISNQNDIDGTVYEASVSRQTVFVEPKEVALLTNKLRQKQNELLGEIYSILQELSKKLVPFSSEIESNTLLLAHWDSVQARARHGRTYSGKAIQVSEERIFFMRQTAHPLLWNSLSNDKIIRNEINFADPVRTLLLTGPNTGGKTVLLKTLGLAGICARTGFPFPATDSPQVPFFDSFFVDLGDPQSLEEHLSTFSGHILRFKFILENLTHQSLVLIDELNSATDPEEGGALGRAFLETLMSRGTMTVTTTHDPNLKVLAATDPRILNASMQFNEKSQLPTYRIAIGIPGRSRAIETAERLGMPKEILALARKYLSPEHKDFEALLSKMEADAQKLQEARREAVSLKEEAERLKKEWTEKTQTAVGEMVEKTRQKLRRILEQAQDEVRSSVQKLGELKSRRDVDLTRSSLNQSFTQSASKIDATLREEAPEIAEQFITVSPPESSTDSSKFSVGDTVKIPKWKSTGTILDISGNKIRVAMGNLQLTLSPREIEKAAAKLGSTQTRTKIIDQDAPTAPPQTLDLRGIRFEEAMQKLQEYLDTAFRSNAYLEVTVVHGLGTGALREGTIEMLKSLPYVKSFRDGGAGRGGTGATLVEFDR